MPSAQLDLSAAAPAPPGSGDPVLDAYRQQLPPNTAALERLHRSMTALEQAIAKYRLAAGPAPDAALRRQAAATAPPKPPPAPDHLAAGARVLPFNIGNIYEQAKRAATAMPKAGDEGGGLGQVAGALGAIVPVAGAVVGAFELARQAVQSFDRTLVDMAASASPSAVSTNEASFELLRAKLGGGAAAYLDQTSEALQQLAKTSDILAEYREKNRPPDDGRLTADKAWQHGPAAYIAAMNAALKGGGWQGASQAFHDQILSGDMDKNMQLPNQAKTFSNFAQYGEELGIAALNSGAKQTDSDVLREQLKNLAAAGKLLTEIAENTAGFKGGLPMFG